jgi:hypothetical protein
MNATSADRDLGKIRHRFLEPQAACKKLFARESDIVEILPDG